MAYVTPRIQIAQEFSQSPVFSTYPLNAFIVGPRYDLHRYSVTAEKASAAAVNSDGTSGNTYKNSNTPNFGSVNNYQATSTDYDYPGLVSGGIVDQAYTKVFFDNAEVLIFPEVDATHVPTTVSVGCATTADIANLASPGAAIDGVTLTTNMVVLVKNQNTASTNGIYTYNGSALVRNENYDATNELSYNTFFKAAAGTSNANKIYVLKADGTHANPVIGTTNINFVQVSTSTVGSPGKKYYTAVPLASYYTSYPNRVIVPGNVKASSHGLSPIYPRSLKVGDYVELADTGGTKRVKSRISGFQAYNSYATATFDDHSGSNVTGAIGGTYTGTADITYYVTITATGAYGAATAKITSNSTDGNSVEVVISSGVPFSLGSRGLTLALSSGTLTEGDVHTVAVTAAAVKGYNVLILEDDVWSASATSTTFAAAATDVAFRVSYVATSLEIPKIQADGATANWTYSADAVTVGHSITVTSSDITVASLPIELPVIEGKVYISYRALVTTLGSSVGSLNDITGVEAALGPIHPDNPLAEGVYNALLNSAGVTVYYVGVPTDDLTGYNAALTLAKRRTDYYSIVPLTFDSTVQDAVVAHVNALSTKEQAKWRIAWLSKPLVTSEAKYLLKTDNTDWLASVSESTPSSGVYDLVTVAGATFVTSGIRSGDTVRINYRLNAAGELVYDTYTVDEVRSQTALKLTADYGSASASLKVEVWHNYTVQEQIDNLAATDAGYDNRRVRVVFPDTAVTAGVTKNGYFVAAALAGLRSGVKPHEPLTNIELLGFDDFSKSVTTYSSDQLDTLAEAGFWIVTQEVVGGLAYTRHQLTSDESGLNYSEDSVTTNVDSISFALQRRLAPYVGRYNVNPITVQKVRTEIDSELTFRMNNTFTERGGNQLNGYTINSVAASTVFKDRIEASISLDTPAPFNSGDITLII